MILFNKHYYIKQNALKMQKQRIEARIVANGPIMWSQIDVEPEITERLEMTVGTKYKTTIIQGA